MTQWICVRENRRETITMDSPAFPVDLPLLAMHELDRSQKKSISPSHFGVHEKWWAKPTSGYIDLCMLLCFWPPYVVRSIISRYIPTNQNNWRTIRKIHSWPSQENIYMDKVWKPSKERSISPSVWRSSDPTSLRIIHQQLSVQRA